MTIEQITERISRIAEMAGDPEVAHSNEDLLWRDFIEWLADTEQGEIGQKAKLVLTTEEIEFPRWCA